MPKLARIKDEPVFITIQGKTAVNVCVLGMGYIGLPTAALLANAGHNVLGVDINPDVVNTINQGSIHIEEPGLAQAVKTAVDSGKLTAAEAPQAAEVFIIAVPTPFKDGNVPDMSYVQSAATAIAKVASEGALVLLESTSPVGATEHDVKDIIEAERGDLKDKLHYVFCPERAIPGNTLTEMVKNDRVVGGLTEAATSRAIEFYKSFVEGELLPTDAATAEMVKLTENASRDVQIAFANELANVCEHSGLDVWKVIQLANQHPRVSILNPGPGVGGHCIAVDPWFIINSAKEHTPLMQTARAINDGRPAHVVGQVLEAMKGLNNPSIGVLGLAFKGNVDDTRQSPAVDVLRALQKATNAKIQVCDPHVQHFDGVELTDIQTASTCDVVVILTDHDEFKDLGGKIHGKVIDTRGVLKKV